MNVYYLYLQKTYEVSMIKRKTKSIYVSEELYNRLKIRANGTKVSLSMLSDFLLNEGLKTLKTIQLPMLDMVDVKKENIDLTENWDDE